MTCAYVELNNEIRCNTISVNTKPMEYYPAFDRRCDNILN